MRRLQLGVIVAALAHSGPSRADPENGWSFQIIPYLWTSGLVGDVTVRSTDVHIDKSFWDLASNLDLGAQVHAEGWWKRRFAFLIDSTFLKATTDVDRGPANAQIESWFVLTDAGGLARLYDCGPAANHRVWIDAKLGIRHTFVKGDLDLRVGPHLVDSRNTVDPILGARVGVTLAPSLFLEAAGDIGGFHVGTNITWSAAAALEYQFNHLIGIVLAYRALGFDSRTGSDPDRFKYDVTMHGPIIGVSFQF